MLFKNTQDRKGAFQRVKYFGLGFCLFIFYLVTQSALAQVKKTRIIRWRGHQINIDRPLEGIPSRLKIDAYPDVIERGYYIVQFKGHATKAMKISVKSSGGELLFYVPDNAFIVRMSAAQKQTVQNLEDVQYIGIYQPGHRISPNLLKRLQGQVPPSRRRPGEEGSKPPPSVELLNLTVLVFKGEDLDRIKSTITEKEGKIFSAKTYKRWTKIRMEIKLEKAQDLALINGVMWIEEYNIPEFTNDVARGILNIADVWAPINGLRGNGQTVAVADTGLDSGVDDATMHNDFQGRIQAIHSWPVQGLFGELNAGADDGAAAENYGHGTHTAGSAVGDGSLSGGTYSGVAPDARLVFQALQQFSDFADNEIDGYLLTGIPDNLNDLFQQAYDDGARIHSNSWGLGSDGEYTVNSEEIDQFVWDHPDMLILFSAGNNGIDDDQNNIVDLGSMNEQASAKNCLTVGATENNRPGIPNTWPWFHGDIINQDRKADSQDGVAAFSSRGPANFNTAAVNDDRIKPDVLAPGTMVVSARTRATPQTVWFDDDMEGGVGGWVAGGTWARTNTISHNGNWCWHDGSAGNYGNNTDIAVTSAVQNISGGGDGTKYLQFWCRYDLGNGDFFRVRIIGDGGDWVRWSFMGDQNDWELITLALGPMYVGWNWYNFSDAPDLEVEFILESDNDGDNGDGVFIDDVRIVEGAFIGAMLSDFGLAVAGTAENDNYVVMGGTSMSTPLTAGCAAIVRQFYQDELGLQYMSAALLRATIINGAVDITPGQYGVGANQEIAARPNNVEGWGRVDLSNTLFPPAPAQIDFKDELAGLNTGEQHEYVLNITDSTVPAVITMVYHDAPGANLVNHLDLTVIEPPGAGGGTLFPNGLAAADDQNNVEQIEIQNPQIGDYTIRIAGQNVNIGPQPYALVTRASGTLADRDPIDIMLALDISGSMQDPASPGGESKLSVLQQAVELFIQLWTAMAVPGDHLGIAYFKTNVAEYEENGIVLLDVLEKAPNLVTDVNGQTTNWSNMTAMGGGLQMCIERLTGIDRFRNIILFTDGMQNVNPMVMEMAGGDFKIDKDPSVSQNSNVNPTAPPTQLDNNLGIKVNTIGVGATDPYMDLMEDIADSTNGLPKLTQAMDEDLRRFFVEDLIDALREHSPQLIGYRHGILSGDSASEAFTISKNAQKIIFKLSGVASDALNLQVFKNGQNMTEAGKMIIGPHYRIYAIDMPYKYKLNRVRAEGVWSMQISGKPGAKYEVAAIVEEPLLECDYRLDQQDYSVGQPLKLNVRLQFGNTPVTDATQVTATILRPKNSVGTLLSTNATPDPIGPNESGITPDLKKFQQLIKNERFYSSLQPDKLSIQLNNNGDGSYSAEYINTYTPGVYTIVFKVSGVGTDIGSFYRTETRSTLVRFGLAEIAISKLVVKLINVTSGGKLFLLSVRPKDKFGNYLGPGYKDQIDFNVDDATSEDELEDLLDGRYAQKILVHADLKDPDLTIEVLGEDIYSGPMSDILPGKRWGVSLHGGTATPRGVMNNNYNPGLLFMVDLSYRINPNWDLVAYAGYNAFKADTTAVDDTYWLNFSLNLKYHFMLTGSALMPNLQGGLGYYIPETGNSSIGVNLGFGLDFILTQSLVFEAGVNYHYLFKGNIEFLQAHGGLIFRF